MLAKKLRIARREFARGGFSAVFRSPILILKVRRNRLALNRLSVTVPKSVSPLSTRRNWLKRRSYAFFGGALSGAELGEPADYLVIFLTGARALLYDESALLRELGRAFQTARARA